MSQSKQSNYKVTFILDMRGYQNTVDSIIEKLSGVIAAVQGQVKEVKNLGVQHFIRVANKKFAEGYYVQFDLEGPRTIPADLRNKLSLDRTVNRMLIESV